MMWPVGVCGKEAKKLAQAFETTGAQGLCALTDIRRLFLSEWEVLALLPDSAESFRRTPHIRCVSRTLLLPEGAHAPPHVRAQQIISYGLSAKSSLTLSSLEGTQGLLCVQRALLRPDGRWVEPCELPLAYLGQEPEQRLLLAGLCLLLR